MSDCREIEEVMFQICHEEATKFLSGIMLGHIKRIILL